MSPKELSKFEDKTSVCFVVSIVPPYLFSDYGADKLHCLVMSHPF